MNPSSKNTTSRRALLGLAVAGLGAVGLAACSTESTDLGKQAKDGSGKGYIAGDGTVREYVGDERSAPVQFTATTFSGDTIEASKLENKATVLNFWYAACAPCRTEAPTLKKLSEEFKSQGVEFIGVNIRDEKAAAEAFDNTFGLSYPSIRDLDGGVLQALTQFVPPQAVPTTLVLDSERRITARVLGVAEEGTLRALIKTALTGTK
ncbi:MAG: TlpA family protein disulfide reductase [Arthrobacter sp.]|nr:TlpA family protein disulfide reductase [Arthrobacter sp.]